MEIRITKNYNLTKLQKWLDYELGGLSLLIPFYFFSPSLLLTIVVVVAIVAATAFTPLLLKVLMNEKRYGWLFTFLTMVGGLPYFLTNYFKSIDWFTFTSGKLIAFLAILMGFYVYCAILRLVIPGWFHEEDMRYPAQN